MGHYLPTTKTRNADRIGVAREFVKYPNLRRGASGSDRSQGTARGAHTVIFPDSRASTAAF